MICVIDDAGGLSSKVAAGVSVAPVTDWRLYDDTHYTERYMDHQLSYARA